MIGRGGAKQTASCGLPDRYHDAVADTDLGLWRTAIFLEAGAEALARLSEKRSNHLIIDID